MSAIQININKKGLSSFVLLAFLLLLPGYAIPAQENRPVVSLFFKHLQELVLDEQQNTRVQEILHMVEKQAEKDHSLYRGNPLALIEAAKRRVNMRDKLIFEILNQKQQQEFTNYLKLQEYNSEFFRLKEGLVLNRDQQAKIAVILDDYNSQMKDLRKKMRENRGSRPGMKGGAGGMGMGQRGSGERMKGGGGGMSGRGEMGGPSRFSGPMAKMKRLKSKKEKAIKKILSKEQKKGYKQIIKFQEEQQALRMKKLRGGN